MRLLLFCLFFTLCLEACKDDAPIPEPIFVRCKQKSSSSQKLSLSGNTSETSSAAAVPEVTFYGNILPILSSTATGSNYKCTTCHAHYTSPSELSTVPELQRVVTAIRNGTMPRGGDRLPAEKVALFERWRDQGFKAGSIGAPPINPAVGGSPDKQTSDDSNC